MAAAAGFFLRQSGIEKHQRKKRPKIEIAGKQCFMLHGFEPTKAVFL